MTSDSQTAEAAVVLSDGVAGAGDEVSALPPASNKILVIGGPRVGKKFILQRLIQATTPLILTPLSLSTSPSTSVSLSTVHWPISTRYYSASLHFHVLNDADIPPFTPSSLADLTASPLMADLQGVMLVYDAGVVGSLEGMKRWGSVVGQVDDDDSVMLMVGVEREEGKGSDDVWKEAREWAIDHSIEHIRLRFDDARPAPPASSTQTHAADDYAEDDDEGVRRILGAFEANHWQSMAMKDRASAARERLLRSEGDDGEVHPLSINARLAQEEEREEAELEAHLQAEAEEEERMERAAAELRQRLELEGAGLDDGEGGVDGEGKTAEERAREEEKFESSMEAHLSSFEAMFERMQTIRNEAMRATSQSGEGAAQSQGKPLSDAERRKRAEDAIMAMLSSMGLDEGEDDDEVDA